MEHPYLVDFFGPQAAYYADVAADSQTGKVRFNAAAFLFGILWMGYRKMYVQAFVAIIIILAEALVEDTLFPTLSQHQGVSTATTLAFNTIIGFVGNRLYIDFARRQVRKVVLASAGETDELTRIRVRKRGGVAWYGPVLVLLLVAAMVVLPLVIADSLGINMD